jgi:hypothetical protein
MRELTESELGWLNADWIKIAGWIGTFTDDEKAAFEKLGDAGDLCMIAWMTQRLRRFGNPKTKPVIPRDPDLREAVLLMKKLGVPWDRMLPDDYD